MVRFPRPEMIRMSWMPARTASSTTYWMAGLSRIGSISFGCAFVAGRNLVPRPAAGMTAFLTFTRPAPSPGGPRSLSQGNSYESEPRAWYRYQGDANGTSDRKDGAPRTDASGARDDPVGGTRRPRSAGGSETPRVARPPRRDDGADVLFVRHRDPDRGA